MCALEVHHDAHPPGTSAVAAIYDMLVEDGESTFLAVGYLEMCALGDEGRSELHRMLERGGMVLMELPGVGYLAAEADRGGFVPLGYPS